MSTTSLLELLSLPPNARADLAIALWESLSDGDRDAALTIDADLRRNLDQRWAEHVANPASAVPWEDVLRKLRG